MESLGKPPIIEAWIGLRFEPNPDRPPWTGEAAREFFSRYSEQFPDAEFEAERRVALEGGSLRELPQAVRQEMAIRKVQVYNRDRSR